MIDDTTAWSELEKEGARRRVGPILDLLVTVKDLTLVITKLSLAIAENKTPPEELFDQLQDALEKYNAALPVKRAAVVRTLYHMASKEDAFTDRDLSGWERRQHARRQEARRKRLQP